MQITTLVIPAAGLGTRFLPVTKAIPKEMLPLFDKPAIHYSAHEALLSGLSQLIIITNEHKQSLKDYFTPTPHLEAQLNHQHKEHLIEECEQLARLCSCSFIYQNEPLGLGHAVLTARKSIRESFFAVSLPDDIIRGTQPALAQLMQIHSLYGATIVAVQEVPREQVSSYGIIRIGKQLSSDLFEVAGMVEKPSSHDAPSQLAIVGRYILSSRIFESLESISTGARAELQLTDGIDDMLKHGERVLAYKFTGTRYDIGTPLGLLKATISYALEDPTYHHHLTRFLAEISTEQRRKKTRIQRSQDNCLI